MMTRALLGTIFLRFISIFPLSVAHFFGRMLGSLFNHTKNDLRKISRMNVHLCFPDWSRQQEDALVREALKHVGMSMMESGALWLWSTERILKLVKNVTGKKLLDSAMARGKGVVLMIPHIGSWEMVGLYISQHYQMTSLYRPPRLVAMGDLVRAGREKMGATLVPTDAHGVRTLRKALSNGELVGILPDQDPGQGAGVFAPFFDVQANTATLLSRLAIKSGAEVLLSYAERLPGGQGYHIHILPSPDCVKDEDAVTAASCINKVVEECALALPEQYLWAYRRFKTRPEGEERMYSPRRKEFLDLD
jgi:KDO2-lipid IV(A) lauroyltransferase